MSSNNNININIPLEISLDILLRLPLKSIFRFKCVCKSWYLLIQSHEFYKLHLNRSLTQNSYNCSLILPVTRNISLNGTPAAASFVYRANLDPNRAQLDLKELILPLSFRPSLDKISNLVHRALNNRYFGDRVYGQIEVVGSCNGLLLIVRGMHHFAICNPAIEHERAFKILPCIKYPSYSFFHDPERISFYYRLTGRTRSLSHRVFGFGYDSVSCAYKVVYLTASRALVYILARDDRSWREINLPYDIINYGVVPPAWGTDQEKMVLLMHVYSHGVAANNHLHWNITEYDTEVFESSREAILSFDICNEEWGKVPMPNELDKGFSSSGFVVKPYIIELGVLNGCLSLITSRGASYPGLDFWIMKEYGVKESWTRMFKVPNGSGIPLFYHQDRFEFLLPGSRHGLGWFNPNTKKIRKVEFHGCNFSGENYYSTRGRMCLESFVDPSGSARIKQN